MNYRPSAASRQVNQEPLKPQEGDKSLSNSSANSFISFSFAPDLFPTKLELWEGSIGSCENYFKSARFTFKLIFQYYLEICMKKVLFAVNRRCNLRSTEKNNLRLLLATLTARLQVPKAKRLPTIVYRLVISNTKMLRCFPYRSVDLGSLG